MPLRTVAVLANPHSGNGAASESAEKACAHFHRHDLNVILLHGRSEDAARALCREAITDARCQALVVCGGDGLIHLALQEQAASGKPLGIIPAGTGNDLARVLGIPRDPTAAATVVTDGLVGTMDLGRITQVGPTTEPGSEWFATVACAGIDAVISARANAMSWPRGALRYNIATAIEFTRFRPRAARIEYDSHVIDTRVCVLAIGNTTTYGGGMHICPQADVTDGLLDVTLMGDVSRITMARHFTKLYDGHIPDTPGIRTFRTTSLRVDVDGITLSADGDPIGPLPTTIEAVPRAGTFLVPEPR